jgi:predicted nucleotidyltransferase
MNWGLKFEQYQILMNILIKPLIARKAKLFVFGSRARGDHHPFSDIDILYVENSNLQIPKEIISQIKEDLEDSDLSIKVDLVNYNDLAKSYLQKIDKEKIQIII